VARHERRLEGLLVSRTPRMVRLALAPEWSQFMAGFERDRAAGAPETVLCADPCTPRCAPPPFVASLQLSRGGPSGQTAGIARCASSAERLSKDSSAITPWSQLQAPIPLRTPSSPSPLPYRVLGPVVVLTGALSVRVPWLFIPRLACPGLPWVPHEQSARGKRPRAARHDHACSRFHHRSPCYAGSR